MNVTCQSCGANERLADRLVAGRTALVRCSFCRGLMVAEPMSVETRRYWAVIATSVCGPFTARELKMLVQHGEIHGESYLWTWDMLGWQRVVDSPRLAFLAAWVRELTAPVLDLVEEIGGAADNGSGVTDSVVPESHDDDIEALVAQQQLPLSSRYPALAEVGLHAALGLFAVTLMGGGLLAGTALMG